MVIVSRVVNPDGTVDFDLLVETDAKYDFAAGKTSTAPSFTLQPGFDIHSVPQPGASEWASVAAQITSGTTSLPIVRVTGSAADYSFASGVVFKLRLNSGGSSWLVSEDAPPAATQHEFRGLTNSTSYIVGVAYRGVTGVEGPVRELAAVTTGVMVSASTGAVEPGAVRVGTDIFPGSGSTPLPSTQLLNDQIGIDANGRLTNTGTGSAVVGNAQITIDAFGRLTTTGTGSAIVDNGRITVDANGFLTNTGAGSTIIDNFKITVDANGRLTTTNTGSVVVDNSKITLGTLGFTGATDATRNLVSTGLLAARPTGVDGDIFFATDDNNGAGLVYTKIAGAWVADPKAKVLFDNLTTTVNANEATNSSFRSSQTATNSATSTSLSTLSAKFTADQQADYLSNGQFLRGTNGWIPSGGASVGYVTPEGVTGRNGVFVSFAAGGGVQYYETQIPWQTWATIDLAWVGIVTLWNGGATAGASIRVFLQGRVGAGSWNTIAVTSAITDIDAVVTPKTLRGTSAPSYDALRLLFELNPPTSGTSSAIILTQRVSNWAGEFPSLDAGPRAIVGTEARVATEETARASADSALATRSTTLESVVRFAAPEALNKNPTFATWSGTLPEDWVDWSFGTANITKATGDLSPFAYRHTNPAGAVNYGLTAALNGRMAQGWHVLEAEVTLNSGALWGGSVHFNWGVSEITNGETIHFAADADITGSVVAAGTVGRRYRFSKLLNIAVVPNFCNIYLMTNWEGTSTTGNAKDLTWHKCLVRPATQGEIDAKIAKDVTIPATIARIATEEGTRATADTALATRATTLEATVNDGTTGVAATAARLTTEEGTRASADSALATRATNLESTVNNGTTGVAATAARLTTEEGTRATADTALAGRATTLEATVNNGTTGVAATAARLTTEEGARASADTALAARATTLEATVNDGTTGLVATRARLVTEEGTRATADTALATRATTLEAVVRFPVPEALNKNPTFATWTGASGTLPEDWSNWSNSFTNTKETGDISPFAYRQAKTAGSTPDWGILQNIYGFLTQGWYVLEADIRLNSGDLNGAGAYVQYGVSTITDSASFGFWYEPDVNGTVHGAGTAGRRYRWAKLVQIINTANIAQIYAMTGWGGFSDTAGSSRDITWHKCSIRPASDSEIELRAARGGAASVGARISTEESTRASADSALATRATTLEATVNNGTTGVAATAARLTTEESTRASADSALAGRATTLEARAAAPGNNMVPNGDLVRGATGWIFYGTWIGWQNDWTGPRIVSFSGDLAAESPNFPVLASQQFTAGVDFECYRDTNQPYVQFIWINGAGTKTYSTETSARAVNTGYSRRFVTATAPAGTVTAAIWIATQGAGTGYMEIRNITCVRGSVDNPQARGDASAILTEARVATEESARASADSALATRNTTLEAIASAGAPGANLVPNSALTSLDGYEYSPQGTGPFVRGLNLSNDWSSPQNPTGWLHVSRNGVGSETVIDERSPRFRVRPSQRYGFAARLAPHRATASVRLEWIDASGAYISNTALIVGGTEGGGNFGNPANFTTVGDYVTLPSNAAFARVIVRLAGKGEDNPYVFWQAMDCWLASSGQTALRPHQDGPPLDRTGELVTLTARVSTEESARASGDSANASLITTLTAGTPNLFPVPTPVTVLTPTQQGWLGSTMSNIHTQWGGGFAYYKARPSGGSAVTEYYYYDLEDNFVLGSADNWTLSALGYGGTGAGDDCLFMYIEIMNAARTSVLHQSPTVIISNTSTRVKVSTNYTGSYIDTARIRVVFARNWAASGSYQDFVFNMVKLERGTVATAYTNSAQIIGINAVSVEGRNRAYAISGTQTEVNGRKGGFVMDNDGVVTNFQITADDFRIYQSVGGSSIVPFRVFGGQTQINDALIRTLSVIPDGGGPSHRVQLRPNSLSGADGASFTFSPAYGGIPLIRPVVLQPPALAAGETYDISATSLSASGFTVRAKKFSAGTPTAQSSGAGSNVGGTPAWQAAKPTSADADGNSYTYSWTATLPRVSNEFMGSNQYYAEYEGEFDVYYDAGSGWVYAYSTYLSFASFYTGSSPSTVTGQAGATTAVLPAIGQHGGNEFGLHAISGTITAFAGVSYTTTSQSSVAALPGNFTFDIYPPT